MSNKNITLTENERELASRIGIEMHKELTDMSMDVMKTLSVTKPKNTENIKITKVVMHVSVFSEVKDIDEELCSTGIVTIDLK